MKIVFEGLPGAGKTNWVQAFSSLYDSPMIPEFACIEEKKWRKYSLKKPFYQSNDEVKDVLGNVFAAEKFVFFDRHYVSTLSYSYALTCVYGGDSTTGETFEKNYHWYKKCVFDGKLTIADYVIYLDIAPETSRKRKPYAGKIDYVWRNLEALSIVRDYYKKFFSSVEPQVKVFYINAERPIYDVFNEIKRILDGIRNSYVS